MPSVDVPVEVYTVDAGCDACGASIAAVPVEVAQTWLAAHRLPVLAAVDTSLGRWQRR